MTITKRLVKGSALTHAELDGNFTDLEGQVAAKANTSHSHTASNVTDFNSAVDARTTGKSDVGHTHVSTAISDSTAAGRALLTGANAAAQRSSLAAASTSQTGQITFFILNVADGDVVILPMEAYGGTVTKVTTDCTSGTCTLTGKINATAFGGAANSVSTTKTSQTHSSANVWAAGDDLVFTASANSSCLGLRVTITYTRTLA